MRNGRDRESRNLNLHHHRGKRVLGDKRRDSFLKVVLVITDRMILKLLHSQERKWGRRAYHTENESGNTIVGKNLKVSHENHQPTLPTVCVKSP